MGKFSAFLSESTEKINSPIFDKLKNKYSGRAVYVHFSGWKPSVSPWDNPRSFRPKKNIYHPNSHYPINPFLAFNKHSLEHEDPTGIYAFPKDYLLNSPKAPEVFVSLPYAYILELTSKAKVLNLNNLTAKDVEELFKKAEIQPRFNELTRPSDLNPSPGKALWDGLDKFADEVFRRRGGKHGWQKAIIKNKLIRKMGFNVVEDEEGVVYLDEPVQTIFLEPAAYKIVDFVYVNREKETIKWVISTVGDIPVKTIKRKEDKHAIYKTRLEITFQNGFKVSIKDGSHVFFTDKDGNDVAYNIIIYSIHELADKEKKLYDASRVGFPPNIHEENIRKNKLDMAYRFCEAFGLSKKNLTFTTNLNGDKVVDKFVKTYIRKTDLNNKSKEAAIQLSIQFGNFNTNFTIKNSDSVWSFDIDLDINDFYSGRYPDNIKTEIDRLLDGSIEMMNRYDGLGMTSFDGSSIYIYAQDKARLQNFRQFANMLKNKVFKIRMTSKNDLG